MSASLPILVAICFVAAFAAPAVVRATGPRSGWLLAVAPFAAALLAAAALPVVVGGEVLEQVTPWVPSLGIELAFRLDGLSLLFALLISGVGTLIAIYAGGYLRGDAQLGRFFLLLLLFTGAMLGAVLADDLIALFVFWELTSLTSYFLVGYKHRDPVARKSALQALLITAAGGLAMLAGFLLLGSATGTLRISEMLTRGDQLAASGLTTPIVLLLALGAFTKSAQFPFHVWLPNAMAAPTPVSAFLHSATMVKLGIYLLARVSPLLGGSALWTGLLGTAGALTLLVAGVLAVRHHDLKALLAYSTLSALGTLTVLLGVGTPTAVKAAVVFLLAHSLYKASLFMVAGNVDHEAGSRDIRQLAGLGRVMPITFGAALLAGLSTAGIPPKLGFIGKEFTYEALLPTPLLLIAVVAGNAVLVGVAGRVALSPFVGRRVEAPTAPHEAPLSMWLGPALLALLGLLFGLVPGPVETALVRPTAASILGTPYAAEVYLWAGLTPALLLSAITVALGLLLLLAWRPLAAALNRLAPRFDRGPAWIYARSIEALPRAATWLTRRIQPTDLRRQLLAILAVAVIATGLVGVVRSAFAPAFAALVAAPPPVAPFVWTVSALIVMATVATVAARTRLAAVTALGAVGFGVALLFVLHAAPDLAITQFLVETLLVVIVALVMIRLPAFAPGERTSDAGRIRDVALAVAGGALATLTTLAVAALPLDLSLTRFFEAESVPGGFGRNIVNVILVDFRAIDTLGEITVLVVAAVGAWALLTEGRRRSGPGRGSEEEEA